MLRLLATLALIWSSLCADAAVLVYHRFDDSRFPTTSIDTQQLREDFNWLKTNGYRVVALEEIIAAVEVGQPIPPKTVALTIDDGYRSFYEKGLPLFKEFGYPFTLFVYTEATEGRFVDFATWDELKEIAQYGSVELHTHAHPHLTRLGDQALAFEVERSIALFERGMGYRPRFLAYPFGEYDDRVRKAYAGTGLKALLNYNGGMIGHHADIMNLDRVGVTGKRPIKALVERRMLDVVWENDILEGDRLGTIKATLKDRSIQKVTLVITGYPDRRIEVKEGRIDAVFNQPIKNSRTLVALKDGKGAIATRLIMKKE